VTLRPKWSKLSDGTTAWQRRVPLFFAAALIASCSALDPNIGPRRLGQSVTDGGLSDTGEPPGFCSGVNPGEVCFARDIRPIILRTRDEAVAMGNAGRGCFPCHNGNAPTHIGTSLSGLDLSTLGEFRKGGGLTGTRIIVPGKPKDSVLVQVLRGEYMYANRMPKNGPFWTFEDEIPLVERWIAEGAKGADGE